MLTQILIVIIKKKKKVMLEILPILQQDIYKLMWH